MESLDLAGQSYSANWEASFAKECHHWWPCPFERLPLRLRGMQMFLFSSSSKHLGDWILALHLASTLWLSSESHLCLTMMALETSNLFEGQSLCLHHHESKSELVDNANHFMVGDNFILSAVTKRHHKLLLILSSAPMITSQQILSSNEVAVDGDSWGSKSRSSNVVGSTGCCVMTHPCWA